MRRLALALLLAAAACAPAPPPHPACRIGPDDGPPLAAGDRGIGGTGRPAALAGGDRGIGGTGVIGVVTGFASICVNGIAVEHDTQGQAVPRDGGFGPAAPLRAGQVVVIRAAGQGAVLRAEGVAVRQEVVGPVTALRPDGLVVAGLPIAFAPALRGGQDWAPGRWVAVSGLPRPDGVIEATRIDPAPPGRALLRGVVARDGAGLRIGPVRLEAAGAGGIALGQPLIATGAWRDGRLVLDGVEPDLTLADPLRRFGPETRRLLVEAFVAGGAGGLSLGPAGPRLPAGPGLPGLVEARRLVVEATREADGGFRAIALMQPPAMSAGDGGPAGPGPGGAAAAPPGAGPGAAPPGTGPGGGGPGGAGRGGGPGGAPGAAGPGGAGPGGGGPGAGGPGGGGPGGGPGGGGPGGR